MGSAVQLGFLEGVPVTVEIELGRRLITLRELIGLKSGSIVLLPRAAGSQLDVCVGGALLARAEVVSQGRVQKVQLTEVGDVE
jgi:flagellar motor switch protein FliN/FliY